MENNLIIGLLVVSYLVPIKACWNLSSANYYPVNLSGITNIPAGIISSDWFGYSGGYIKVSALQPGYGYWVKLFSDGWFVLQDE
jgi:hypothetical protein